MVSTHPAGTYTAKAHLTGSQMNHSIVDTAATELATSVHDQLVKAIIKEIREQFGEQPLKNDHYGRIINEKHFLRLCGLLMPEKIICYQLIMHTSLTINIVGRYTGLPAVQKFAEHDAFCRHGSLRDSIDYESMELSFHARHRATGGCFGGG